MSDDELPDLVLGDERPVPCEACDTTGVVKRVDREQACMACDGFGWRAE